MLPSTSAALVSAEAAAATCLQGKTRLKLTDTDFVPGAETIGDDGLGDVILGDGQGSQFDEGHIVWSVVEDVSGDAGGVLTLEETDGGIGSGLSLQA